jgi:enamine deaminase RidA (YjgF/YER057c/UK114 family)
MGGRIEAHLRSKGIELPKAAAPGASYISFVRTGNLVFISGQISKWNGERRFIGKVGREFQVAEGREAARLCALNLVAILREAAGGDLDRVRRAVKLTGFVNATPDFLEPSQVIDGASDALVEIFGDAGRHARSAVGVATLPYGVAVEVEAIFEVEGA